MPDIASLVSHIDALGRAEPQWYMGALGVENALRCIAGAVRQPELRPLGERMAWCAWQEHPLDAQLARLVWAGMEHGSLQAAPATRVLCHVLRQWCTPPAAPPADLVASPAGNLTLPPAHWCAAHETLLRVLTPHFATPSGGYWLAQAWAYCQLHPDAEDMVPPLLNAAFAVLPVEDDSALRDGVADLTTRLLAEWHSLYSAPARVLQALDAPLPLFPWWQHVQRAQAALRAGEGDPRAALDAAWTLFPAHPNVLLALYELTCPCPAAPAQSLPPLAVYSWNNAALLRDTLHALAATEAVEAPLLLLDNGSEDATPTVLREAASRWRGPARCLTLPVNIGAPAARNWLLAQEEIQQAGQILFLDDDVQMQAGWLHALAAVLHAHPEAAVLGCAIDSIPAPHTMQNGEFFLLAQGARSYVDVQEHVFIHSAVAGSQCSLLTRYTRPCVSVSGCCHWLRLDAAHGGCVPFDVGFNPSQFDDFARDMTLQCAGQRVLYTGVARIRHVQRSSLQQAVTRAQNAHIFGNKLKLECAFSAEDCTRVRVRALADARQDILRKAAVLCAR